MCVRSRFRCCGPCGSDFGRSLCVRQQDRPVVAPRSRHISGLWLPAPMPHPGPCRPTAEERCCAGRFAVRSESLPRRSPFETITGPGLPIPSPCGLRRTLELQTVDRGHVRCCARRLRWVYVFVFFRSCHRRVNPDSFDMSAGMYVGADGIAVSGFEQLGEVGSQVCFCRCSPNASQPRIGQRLLSGSGLCFCESEPAVGLEVSF